MFGDQRPRRHPVDLRHPDTRAKHHAHNVTATLADRPDALLALLVERGHLEQMPGDLYRRVKPSEVNG